MKPLLTELKRRNVLRVAAFYAAAGWLLVQVATQVLPVFEVPALTMRVVVVARAGEDAGMAAEQRPRLKDP